MNQREQWQELREEIGDDTRSHSDTRETSGRNLGGLDEQPEVEYPKMFLNLETFGDCYLEKNKKWQRRYACFGWGRAWSGGMVSETNNIDIYMH